MHVTVLSTGKAHADNRNLIIMFTTLVSITWLFTCTVGMKSIYADKVAIV